jgi:tetratricopeptide (TPR) repeat protein
VAICATVPTSMIPNRVDAEPPRDGNAVAPPASSSIKQTSVWRIWLILLAAGIAVCIPSASFARRQNASAAGMQADRQQELARSSQAAKDVDVGTFYMHKGDYGAAISRFKEAVQLDPRYPKARLLLAESYEKQGDRTHALQTYRAYLKAFPDARDDKKIQKKIVDLSRKRD